jgi:methylmalonyl-CoA/ethylmalonyl-CoA epimerase
MENINNPLIKVTELEQAGFVVRNAEKSAEFLWNTFGIGPWDLIDLDAELSDETTYYGKPAKYSFRLARTQKKVGGVEIELIESLEGDTIYRDFLRDHGEGFHHMGWHKVKSLEAFKETIRILEKAGFPCIMSGRVPLGVFAYFDTNKVFHTILEVIYESPSSEMPPIYRVIPG